MSATSARRRRAGLALGAVGALLVAGLGLAADAPAATTTSAVLTVPADRTIEIAGHGWGHGRGMSQYGAAGAATLGKSAAQILDAYYPGTTAADQGNPTIRVQLRSQETAAAGRLDVADPGTLTFTDEHTGTRWTGAASTAARWRVVTAGASLRVQHLTGSTWTTDRTVTGPVRVDASTGPNRVLYPVARSYTGAYLRVSHVSATHLTTVDVTSMETYLRGVVPAESISSWPAAALQAQAVAARSYSANRAAAARRAGAAYDLCDTTACQVYAGDGAAVASTDAAVRATAGTVRTWKGAPVFAEFSSSDGGWTTAGDQPYLTAHADPWDGVTGSSVHAWTARLPASALESRYPALGTLRSLQVLDRDGHGAWGGRVGTVRLVGSRTTLDVTGRDVATAWSWPAHASGLRSSWWTVRDAGTDTGGDAVGDLVAGLPGRSGGAGEVALVAGRRAAALSTSGRGYTQASGSVPGAPEAGDAFAGVLAAGDFDGDGRQDVAVGVPGEDVGSGATAATDAGSVQVLRGAAVGLTAGRALTLATAGVPGAATAGARFGAALAAGDVDGDGYDDLVVGAPGAVVGGRAGAGSVTLLRGSRTGLTTTGARQWVQSAGETPEAGDRLGSAVAVGDVTGDGRLDVAVGSPGERTGDGRASGSVRLLRWSASGLVGSTDLWGSILGDRGSFGRSLVLADTDRDGRADLVAGGLGSVGGTVTVVLGRTAGLTGPHTDLTQDSPGVPGADEAGDDWGRALAAGDVNGDGYADVAVGAPGESIGTAVGAGSVTLLPGGAGGVGRSGALVRRQGASGVPGTGESGDGFGTAVAVTDLTGDGTAELVVGVPGEDGGSGLVDVVPGSEHGLATSGVQQRSPASLGLGAHAGDRLGGALAP